MDLLNSDVLVFHELDTIQLDQGPSNLQSQLNTPNVNISENDVTQQGGHIDSFEADDEQRLLDQVIETISECDASGVMQMVFAATSDVQIDEQLYKAAFELADSADISPNADDNPMDQVF